MENQCGAPQLPVAGPDREVWVRNQVLTAMEMALALRSQRQVRADEDAFQGGLRGVAEGAAIEILRTLGFSTHALVNLRGPQGGNNGLTTSKQELVGQATPKPQSSETT